MPPAPVPCSFFSAGRCTKGAHSLTSSTMFLFRHTTPSACHRCGGRSRTSAEAPFGPDRRTPHPAARWPARPPPMARVDPSAIGYGSDRHGLVCAFRFGPGVAPREVDADDALEWLTEQGRPGDPGF